MPDSNNNDQAAVANSLVGMVLNSAYKIERQLADGGMSLIFLAEQLSLERTVVLKVLRPDFDDEDFIQLFLREARIISHITHPAVVSVFDYGHTDNGLAYIAMELLDGVTLADVVESDGPLPLGNVVWVMEQVCAGIHAAHKLDVVHRDLKPNNIMIVQVTGGDTLVKVLDFGISKPLGEEDLKHTQLGMVMGTPGYLSPEQIQGIVVDPRSDVYALGALLYFMLTGKRPFSGASHQSIMAKQLSGKVPQLADMSISDAQVLSLQPVIDGAMALDREQRYSSVKEFWQALLGDSKSFEKVAINDEVIMSQASGCYEVVSKGCLLEDVTQDSVVEALQRLLEMTFTQARQLATAQRPVVIRRNLNRRDADRLKVILTQVGLSVEVVARKALESESGDSRPRNLSDSLLTPGMIQPMTVTQLTAVLKRQVPDSSEDVRPAQSTQDKPRSKSRQLVAALLIMFVVSGAAVYWMWRYPISDFWVQIVMGQEPPRGVSTDGVAIGMSAAFHGSAKELGRSMRVGVEAYFQRINALGGVHGRLLELKARNDSYEPKLALENMAVFLDKDNGVFSLLGNVGTPTARAILPVALENKLLIMGTFSGAEILRHDPPDRYVFNYRASYAEETAAMIHYFVKVKNLRPERIGVFYQNDSYGLDGLSGVIDALQEYDVERESIVTASYERNTVQVERASERFINQDVSLDAVVLVGAYSASAAFTRIIRLGGFSGEIGNVSFVGSRALADEFQEMGQGIGNGVLVTQVVPLYDSYASGVLRYREDMERFFPNEDLGFVSLEGYIVAELFCQALQQVGRYFSIEDVVDTLESFSTVDLGVGHPLHFNPSDHQASHQVWGTRITESGTFEEVDLDKVRL